MRKMTWGVALIASTAWAQQEGVMPWTNGRPGWGPWAATDLPVRTLTASSQPDLTSAEFRAPLHPSSCWSYRLATTDVAGRWVTAHLAVSHEIALAPGWTARCALGAVREAWPDLGRIGWSPEWAAALQHTTPQFTAGTWLQGQFRPPARFHRTAGAFATATWADWAATLSTFPLTGTASRTLSAGWRASFGWNGTAFAFGVHWSPSPHFNSGLLCSQPPWGRTNWIGYANWQ